MNYGISLLYLCGYLLTFGKPIFSSPFDTLLLTTEFSLSLSRLPLSCVRWMIGEAHDYQYPDEFPVSIQHTDTSAVILTAALIWELFYYMIILPFNLLPCSKQALLEYDDGTLQPRFPCFRNFRQYENLHMLFWIAKDLAWNRLKFEMWIISVIPTILIAADFIYISAKNTKHVSYQSNLFFNALLLIVLLFI